MNTFLGVDRYAQDVEKKKKLFNSSRVMHNLDNNCSIYQNIKSSAKQFLAHFFSKNKKTHTKKIHTKRKCCANSQNGRIDLLSKCASLCLFFRLMKILPEICLSAFLHRFLSRWFLKLFCFQATRSCNANSGTNFI